MKRSPALSCVFRWEPWTNLSKTHSSLLWEKMRGNSDGNMLPEAFFFFLMLQNINILMWALKKFKTCMNLLSPEQSPPGKDGDMTIPGNFSSLVYLCISLCKIYVHSCCQQWSDLWNRKPPSFPPLPCSLFSYPPLLCSSSSPFSFLFSYPLLPFFLFFFPLNLDSSSGSAPFASAVSGF